MVTKFIHKIKISLFLVVILLPFIGHGFNLDFISPHQENRKLKTFPELNFGVKSILRFAKKYPAYFNDNFGFRNTLIQWYAMFQYYGFKVSPNKKVILGKENWLFLGEFSNGLSYYRRTDPFTDKELKCYTNFLETRKKWLSQRGVEYLFVIAPNKNSIYPEFMPPEINQIYYQSRLEQLVSYLKENSDIEILNLVPILKENKSKYLVYHRTDTHWNDRGAYLSYRKIINSINQWFPNLKALPISYFNIEKRYKSGDLANIMSLRHKINEEAEYLVPKFPFIAQSVSVEWFKEGDSKRGDDPFATRIMDESLPRALMFGDSFTWGTALHSFLSEHFQHITYVRQNDFAEEIINKEKPDIVIEEIVERKLMNPCPEFGKH